MNTGEYINQLRQQHIVLQFANGELKIKAEKDALTDQLIAELRQRKPELLAYFRQQQAAAEARTIAKAAVKEHYPLAPAQRRLYFMHGLHPQSLSYNLPYVLHINGQPGIEKINGVFAGLIARHESFRTSFVEYEEEVRQVVSGEVVFRVEQLDTTKKNAADLLKEFVRPFDLSAAPLLRAAIITISEQEYILAIDMHHIIADGVSRDILVKEFMSLYLGQSLPVLPLSYTDYAEWQLNRKQLEQVALQRSFWMNELEGCTALDLPVDNNRPAVRTGNGASFPFSLTYAQTQQVKNLAAAENLSLFMLLLSLYTILLSKLCNQEDIIVGIPVAGRHHADLEGIIGMFVNTLPVRNYPSGEMRVKDYLAAVKARTLAALEHQEYQYEEMIDALKVPRDTSRHPLFDTVLSFQNFEDAVLELPGMEVKASASESHAAKFDLSLLAWESENCLHFAFEYATDIFSKETIARFAGYWNELVTVVLQDTGINLSAIDILPVTEKRRLLLEFNDTRIDYPEDKDLVTLFEEQVAARGNDTAVSYDGREVSYSALNNMADAVAAKLAEQFSPEPHDNIAFIIEPSVEMIAAMLAIVKTGCPYIALSTAVPAARNQLILKDAAAKWLITDARTLANHPGIAALYPGKLLIMNEEMMQPPAQRPSYRKANLAESILYVIYTSGSTGTPKGVEVRTAGILNMIYFYRQAFGIKAGMRSSQCATIVFDASAFEIWPCLTAGASLHIAAPQVRQDAQLLADWLTAQQVNITFQPPAMAELLLKQPAFIQHNRLTVMNVAGDVLNYFPEQKLPFRLFNLYGPTEDSIWTSWLEWKHTSDKTRYSIGRPIANKKIYILDKYQRLVPPGVAGELCISGKGLAKGYLGNEPLTNEKFIRHPFADNERLYKTGDLARWSANGEIEFLGRIDQQLKIRGFRVEIGEIEQQLAVVPGIKESVVVARESGGRKYLVAYYVPSGSINAGDIKQQLQQRLPDYMLPSFFVELQQLPLHPSGKINRNALPEPDRTALQPYIAPASEVESKLVELWSSVLKIDPGKISVNVNFFEIGGDSISIQKLNSRINHHFGSTLSIADMFRLPTIRGMKDFISGGQADSKKLEANSNNIEESISEANDMFRIMETL